jgi:hypothetical protein
MLRFPHAKLFNPSNAFPALLCLVTNGGTNMPNRHRQLNALIIYDKIAAARKASAALQQVACCAKIAADWNIKPWRLDVLRLPAASDEALIEATDADLIVLAGAGAYSFPSWLREWLECWANHRQVGDAALARIHDGTEGEHSAAAVPELSRFAAHHGLGLIAEIRMASDALTPSEHTSSLARVSSAAIPASIHSSHQGWGIND